MGLLDRYLKTDPDIEAIIAADQEHQARRRRAYEANRNAGLDPEEAARLRELVQHRSLRQHLASDLGPISETIPMSQWLREGFTGRAQQLGIPDKYAPNVGKAAAFVSELNPLVSLPEAMIDVSTDRPESLYAATQATLNAMPGVGKFAKLASKVDELATPIPKEPGGVLGEVAKEAGKRRAITAVSLRELPPEEAIKIARTQQHIIPSRRGFSGAPDNVKTMRDLARMRRNFDKQVEAGLVGANWYGRTQDWVKRMAGPEPKAQSELAHNLGIMSSQADPKGNLGFSNRARNAAIMDMPVDIVHTGRQARDYQRAYEQGVNAPTGRKTGIFARTMDPTEFSPTTGTNDIWHARAFGYTNPKNGKPWDAALSDQQHAFLDAETVLAVDRANARKLGGRSDWTAGEIQAAPWVAMKGRDLMRKNNNTKAVKSGKEPPMTEAEGMELAKKTFPDFEEAFTGYGQHEMTPGVDRHLPGITAGDWALRQRFADDPRSGWKGPGDRDVLYAAQRAYTAPTENMTGVFEGKTNPGQSARPQIAYEGPSGKRVMDEASKQLMGGTEAFRAYIDAQKSGGYIDLIPDQQIGHMNAYQLSLPENMRTSEGLLGAVAKAQGAMPGGEIVHLGGPKGLLTDWREKGVKNIKERRGVSGLMGELGIGVEPVRREGAMAPPYDPKRGAGGYDWTVEGSDTATKQMLAEINPAQRKAFEKPEVRARVLARMERDNAFADVGKGVGKDIQFARKTFFEKGFKGLEAALGKGLLPAAAIGIFLPYLMQQPDEKRRNQS